MIGCQISSRSALQKLCFKNLDDSSITELSLGFSNLRVLNVDSNRLSIFLSVPFSETPVLHNFYNKIFYANQEFVIRLGHGHS